MIKIRVLDEGFVKLLDVMPRNEDADKAVVDAARVSYNSKPKTFEQDTKLLRYLFENKHTSPFEQVEFKFKVRAPLVVMWQWVRHRTFSYNAQSGRYTEFKDDLIYFPEFWRLQSKNNKQMSDGIVDKETEKKLSEKYKAFVNESLKLYKDALDLGIAREQARLFLPGFSVYYDFIVKANAHNLMHFIELRTHPHSQWEIRQYAFAVKDIFSRIMPRTSDLLQERINERH